MRGHTHLLKNIHRRKPVHSHSFQNQINGPLAESERRELEDEINRLKYEKSVLVADLHRQAEQQCGINWQMQSLEERLMLMEQRQKNIIASLCDILQRRGAVSSSLVETDHFSKKRRVPKIDFFVEEPAVEEQQVPYSRTMVTEIPSMFPMHPVHAEPLDRMELALVSLERFFQRANYAASEDMYNGATAPSPALPLVEMQTAPMETSVNLQPSASLHPSSPNAGHVRSSPELAESPSYVQSPMLPLTEIHEDTHKTMTEVDMNSDNSTSDTSQDETTETGVCHEPAKVNDLFWERFLTETPHSFHACGAGSERQDADGKRETAEAKDDARIGVAVDCNCLNHRDNVDKIIEHMGHLASAEKT